MEFCEFGVRVERVFERVVRDDDVGSAIGEIAAAGKGLNASPASVLSGFRVNLDADLPGTGKGFKKGPRGRTRSR